MRLLIVARRSTWPKTAESSSTPRLLTNIRLNLTNFPKSRLRRGAENPFSRGFAKRDRHGDIKSVKHDVGFGRLWLRLGRFVYDRELEWDAQKLRFALCRSTGEA
jgi:hypothetical protein